MSVPAWQILVGLPAWRVTQIPRSPLEGGDAAVGAALGRSPARSGDRGQRMLSLASAARSGSAAAFGWVRDTGNGPVKVIAAGKGLCADDDGTVGPADLAGPVPLGYPAGALGRPLPSGALTEAFTALPYWMPVAITPDALLAEIDDDNGNMSPEDGLLRAWRKPFGWLVIAAPVRKDRREELLSEASLAQLMADRHDSPRARQSAVRSKARHGELRQAATTGLWNIWLLVGAATPAGAARVAGLLCASLDLRGLPFGLTEQDACGPLPELLGAPAQTPPAAEPGPLARDVLEMYGGREPEPGPRAYRPSQPGPGAGPGPAQGSTAQRWGAPEETDNGFPDWAPTPALGWAPTGQQATWAGGQPSPARVTGGSGPVPDFPDPEPEFPCAASSRLLAALAVPPTREIPGIRMMLQPTFDVSPETGEDGDIISADASDPDSVALGTVLDASRMPSSALSVPRASLNRHTFVCGATGAGKSQTVRHLLESATEAGIPWMVIEPAKAEYRLMAARLPAAQVITIRPGDLNTVPAGINPLEPTTGSDGSRFPLQAHGDLVRALFLAAFQADEPFPQVLAAALARCYTEAGWDMVTGEPSVPGTAYPTLGSLQAAALAVVEDIGYSQEITDNVRGFVSVRIGSLIGGTTGRFLNGGFPLDYAKLLDGNVVMEIEDCGDDTDKAFMTGAVLIRLTEHLRMRARAEGPRSSGLRHLTVVEEAPPAPAPAPARGRRRPCRARRGDVRRAPRRGPRLRRGPSHRRADPEQADSRRHQEHRGQDRPPAPRQGRPGHRRRDDEPHRRAFRVPGYAPARGGCGVHRRHGLPRPGENSRRDPPGRSRPGQPGNSDCPGDGPQHRLPRRLYRFPMHPRTDRRRPAGSGRRPGGHNVGRAHRNRALGRMAVPLTWGQDPGQAGRHGPRLRDCTLARAIDDAVTTRIPAISARVAGPALVAHAAQSMHGILDDDYVPCDGHEPQWLAPALTDTGKGEEPRDEGPLRDTPPLRDAVLGTRSPSMIEKAAKTWAHDPDFAGRLAAALTGFPDGSSYAGLIADAATGQR